MGLKYLYKNKTKLRKSMEPKPHDPYDSESVLHKHKMLEHLNEEVEYGLEIASKFKDALSIRQANKAVRINSRKYINF